MIRKACYGCGAPAQPSLGKCGYCGGMLTDDSAPRQREDRFRQVVRELGAREASLAEFIELGEISWQMGKISHAREYLRKAVEVDPLNWRARLLLILCLLGFNQDRIDSDLHGDEIRLHLDPLRKHFGALPEVSWLGYYFDIEAGMKAKDWDRAITLGRHAVERFPENYLLHTIFAQALLRDIDINNFNRSEFLLSLHHFGLAHELNEAYKHAENNIENLRFLLTRGNA